MEDEQIDEFELFRTQSLMGGREVQRSSGKHVQIYGPRHKPPRPREDHRNRDEADDHETSETTDASSSSNARARRQRFRSSGTNQDDANGTMHCEVQNGIADCNGNEQEIDVNNTEGNYGINTNANRDDELVTDSLDIEGAEQRLFRTYSDKKSRSGARLASPVLDSDRDITVDTARHKRTQSMPMKRRRRAHQRRSHVLLEPTDEMAGGVDEGEQQEENVELCRVRSFSTRSGEIINRGDSFKIRNSPRHGNAALRQKSSSNDSGVGTSGEQHQQQHQQHAYKHEQHVQDDVAMTCKQLPVIPTVYVTSGETGSPVKDSFDDSPHYHQDENDELLQKNNNDNSAKPACYYVVVIGGSGVGKTALRQQLMTSEYLANSDINDIGNYHVVLLYSKNCCFNI